jgi:hypothetical protein
MASITSAKNDLTFNPRLYVGFYQPGLGNINTSQSMGFPTLNQPVEISRAILTEFGSTFTLEDGKLTISNTGWEIIIVCFDNHMRIFSHITTIVSEIRAKFTYILYNTIMTLAPRSRLTIQKPVQFLASVGDEYNFHCVARQSTKCVFKKRSIFIISAEALGLNGGDTINTINQSQAESEHKLAIQGYGYKISAIFRSHDGNITFHSEPYLEGNHAIHAALIWVNFQELFATNAE